MELQNMPPLSQDDLVILHITTSGNSIAFHEEIPAIEFIRQLQQQNEGLRKDLEGMSKENERLRAEGKEAQRNAHNASINNSKLIGQLTMLKEENERLISERDELLQACERATNYLHIKFPKEADIFNQLQAAINNIH